MGKNFLNFWKNRRERFYRKQKWHLVLDFSLMLIMLVLAGVSIRMAVYSPSIMSMIKWPISSSTSSPTDKQKILNFDLTANADKKYVQEGESIKYLIEYKNSGEKDIDKLSLEFSFVSAAFSLKSIESNNPDLDITSNQIIIKNIKAGEQKDFEINLNWKTVQSDFPRSIQCFIRSIAVASDNSQIEKVFNLEDIKIASNLDVSANLFYHSLQGDQLGIGPIPPVVGIATKYWLIVTAKNFGNQLQNLVFSAQLEPGVELAEEYSLLSGKFSYNQERRLLIWQVDSLDASGGNYVANFAVKLVPTKDQLGKNAPIISNIRYHVYDSWTDTEISNFLLNLDSSLPADTINRGEGVVTEN